MWRNSDDSLLILDGTTEECCAKIGVSIHSFATMLHKTSDRTKYRIVKTSVEDIKREAES